MSVPIIRCRLTGLAAALALALAAAPVATARAEGLFSAIGGIPTGANPRVLAIADCDEDGRADIAAGFDDEGRVTIYLGDGDGTFTAGASYTLGSTVMALDTADVDGDGHTDLVGSMDYYTPRYFVLLGNGNGTFQPLEPVWPDRPIELLLVREMTGDGRPDLVVLTDDSVDLYPGNGDGTFGEPSAAAVGSRNTGMATGDFDGNGATDLAVVSYYSEDLVVLLNDGTGNLATGFTALLGDSTLCVAAGDLDEDGVPDLCVGTAEYERELVLFTGDGDGTFTEADVFDLVDDAAHVCLEDLDRDGTVDLLVQEDLGNDWMSVILGTGGGTFADPIDYGPIGDGLGDASLADFNGDDTPDIACCTGQGLLAVIKGAGDGSFPIPAGIGPGRFYSVDSGDLDGDGDPEIVAPSYGRLYIFFSEDGWSFGTTYPFPLEGQVDFARTCDLDGDPLADLVTSGINADQVNAYTGNGDGTFLLRGQYAIEGPKQVLPCELNNDGLTDLAVPAETEVHVLLGTGGGGFTEAGATFTGHWPVWLAAADLDGDGFDDLATVHSDDDTLAVLINDGTGHFPSVATYNVGTHPTSVALADVDQDGDVDAAVALPNDGMVRLRFNDGSGVFDSGQVLAVLGSGYHILLEDLDDDARVDLAVAHGITLANMLSVRRGLGGGAFGNAEVYIVNHGSFDEPQLCAADFDADGDRDLAFINRGSGLTEGGLVPLENLTGIGPLLVTGPGRATDNPPRVRVTRAGPAAACLAQWSAYGVPRYGANVACADLTGNGAAEVLTGPGPGAVFGPHVRGFRVDGTPLAVSFLAYGTSKYGVNVAGGDIDGDGYGEIVTGAGPGAVFGPHVRGWNWDGAGAVAPIPGISYFAYGTPKWGVNVACGDIDGDGFDEIVTGAGPGAVYGPHVRGWNWDGAGPIEPLPGVSFLAYGTNKFGVNVCCGDVDGDGIDELVTGAGPGEVFGAHVRGWNWDGAGGVTAIPGISFFAYAGTRWGANVGCGDVDGDGLDELITGPGPDPSAAAEVRCWNYDGEALAEMSEYGFVAYNPWTIRHGVKVAGVRAGD